MATPQAAGWTAKTVDLTDEERAPRQALRAEFDRLQAEYVEPDELPDEVDQRLGEIETALAGFGERPVIYDPAEIARAGAFVGIDQDRRRHYASPFVIAFGRAALCAGTCRAPIGKSVITCEFMLHLAALVVKCRRDLWQPGPETRMLARRSIRTCRERSHS